jgi:phage FluMu protein Com
VITTCIVKPVFLLAFAVNQHGLTPSIIREMFRGGARYFEEVGICPRLKKVKRIPAFNEPTTYERRIERFEKYIKFAHHKKLGKGVSRIHYVLTPEFIEEHRSIAGGAYVCSKHSYSTAQLFDETYSSRFEHSIIAMTHEMAHALGAFHDKSSIIPNFNIMDPAPLSHVGFVTFGFSEESKKQILGCLK